MLFDPEYKRVQSLHPSCIDIARLFVSGLVFNRLIYSTVFIKVAFIAVLLQLENAGLDLTRRVHIVAAIP